MRYLSLMLLGLLCAASPLFAQGFGGGMAMGADAGGTQMVNTPKGLFALRNGVLAKFSTNPLKQVQELQLFGPAPEQPKDNTNREAMMAYYAEIQRRSAPAVMLAKDNVLIIVAGDGFARINQDTLKAEVTANLASGAPAPAAGGRAREQAPGYLLVDNTLYLLRNTEMLAINITDGKFTRTPVSKAMQPPAGGGFRGTFGGGGGGRDGGNRGAGGAGARGNGQAAQ